MYDDARAAYAALGIDTEAAFKRLDNIAVSLHCWQGDDVQGFENSSAVDGGLAVTGNYPGRARNADELRADFEQALKLRKGYIYSVGKSLSVKRMEHKPRNPLYVIHISHRQLRELSFQCEQHSRFITGQLDFTLQEAVESAWEKRYAASHPLKENGYKDHGIGTKEWHDVRHNTEAIINDIRWECWQCTRSSNYGVHYDDESDMYWDIYEVFRHQLWLDRPDEKKCGYTVDAYPAHRWGNEPLIKIKRINNN